MNYFEPGNTRETILAGSFSFLPNIQRFGGFGSAESVEN